MIASRSTHSATWAASARGTKTQRAADAIAGSTETAMTFSEVNGRQTPTTADSEKSEVVDR